MGLSEFLAGLELKVQIERMPDPDQPFSERLARAAQLTQRTNQFNFTTRRRSESDLQKLSTSAEILTVSVNDRFGDYGLTGLMVFEARNGALDVDTFLLSCRVLGRGVEHRMLGYLGEFARERGLNWVDIHFNISPKNRPALDFLESIGTSFRQPLNGGYLFRFPAGFAAEVSFNPQTENNSRLQPSEGDRRPASDFRNEVRRGSSAPLSTSPIARLTRRNQTKTDHPALPFIKFVRCRQIALGSSDPAQIHQRIEAAVSSSEQSTVRLKERGIRVVDLNSVGELALYVDGADECDGQKCLIKGGGAALTREKIIAAASKIFVCMIDSSKRVDVLGKFPLPLEVIPMAREYVARQIIKRGGRPTWREKVVTDNGNCILDVHDLKISDPVALEADLNQITGVVCAGLFAQRPADIVLIGDSVMDS